jgi:hypothetical protein
VLAEKLPELLDFPKDLVSLEASTKVFFLVFFGGGGGGGIDFVETVHFLYFLSL